MNEMNAMMNILLKPLMVLILFAFCHASKEKTRLMLSKCILLVSTLLVNLCLFYFDKQFQIERL